MRRNDDERIAEVLAGPAWTLSSHREDEETEAELTSDDHEGCDVFESSGVPCECSSADPKRSSCRCSSGFDEDGEDEDEFGIDALGKLDERDHEDGFGATELATRIVRPPRVTSPRLRAGDVAAHTPSLTVVATACEPLDTSGNRADYRPPPAYGSCNQTRRFQVRQAYNLAYRVIRAAEAEIDHLAAQVLPLNRRLLWEASEVINDNAPAVFQKAYSLGFWFGQASAPDFSYRVHKVQTRIRAWSRCFREGFSASGPVLILCKKKGESCPKSIAARHIFKDTISLCPRWWTYSAEERALTLLHEMGHYSGGDIYHPRDERSSDYCSGGWNLAKNMCYRTSRVYGKGTCTQTDDSCPNGVYTFGNPRELAKAFQKGSKVAMAILLNNVDNYICWMWNRWIARGTCIQTVSPGSKVPLP